MGHCLKNRNCFTIKIHWNTSFCSRSEIFLETTRFHFCSSLWLVGSPSFSFPAMSSLKRDANPDLPRPQLRANAEYAAWRGDPDRALSLTEVTKGTSSRGASLVVRCVAGGVLSWKRWSTCSFSSCSAWCRNKSDPKARDTPSLSRGPRWPPAFGLLSQRSACLSVCLFVCGSVPS